MIGRTLAHYEIVEQIGAGGMGAVYRARDTKLGRDVALKVLPPDAARDPERTQRFEREARAVAALGHPNIVTIHSVEVVDGVHFLTMELVDGQALSEIIPPDGLPLEHFLRIALPLADAVSLAHAKGITHRDLKPANIMVDGDGRVKVLDFGLAKLWFPDVDSGETIASPAPLTEAGRVLGTAAYMSPEQVAGGTVDSRSDVFALGILFHELLSGAPPFRGDYPAAIMHAIVAEDAPRLAAIPDVAADIVARCLRKAPAERFADAAELRSALQFLTTTPDASAAGTPEETSAARAAFDRCDWQEAYDLLRAAGEQRELSAAELELLANSALWLSEAEEATQARERAHAAYAKAGQNASAARVALLLVADRLVRGEGAVAGGWLKRAERLLENEPECAEHGWLLRRQSMSALGSYDFATALERNDRCRAIADRFRDADLQTVALHDRGQILVARGDVEEGRALIDEAMASAMSGDVTPHTVGLLFCRTLSVCDSLADFNRAREWSDAAWRWGEPFAESTFHGICRVHNAEMLRHQGLWTEAEQAARAARDHFLKVGLTGHTGGAALEIGELALRKGNYEDAEEAFREAHECGCDPVPGLPLLRLVQGRKEAALQTIRRALNEVPQDRLRRAKLLAPAIFIALANDDLSFAEDAVDELAEVSRDLHCPTFQAHASMGRGAVALARNEADTATAELRQAWSKLHEMNYPYEAARARTLLARAYLEAGNTEDATLQLRTACKTFEELGARPDLESASALMPRETRGRP